MFCENILSCTSLIAYLIDIGTSVYEYALDCRAQLKRAFNRFCTQFASDLDIPSLMGNHGQPLDLSRAICNAQLLNFSFVTEAGIYKLVSAYQMLRYTLHHHYIKRTTSGPRLH